VALKAGFGEYSLPFEVRNCLIEQYPSLPRSFINGLRAISKSAFAGSGDEQMERLERAIRILKTADYFAPEYYAHTNSNLPDHVLTVLAGEAELEYSEDLDSILPDEARALLQEFRAISKNSDALNEITCSQDARFISLIRLYTEMDDYLDMLHTGEIELGGSEKIQALKQNNHLRDNILDADTTKLENSIFNTLRRIDMIHQYGATDSMWQIAVTRHSDFDEMSEAELLELSDIPSSDALEIVLGIALQNKINLHGLDRVSAFAMLAERELSAIREVSKHFDSPNPAVLSALLIGHDGGSDEVLETVINELEQDGEDIAYIRSAIGDQPMLSTLPQDIQDVLNGYEECLNIVEMNYLSKFLTMINPHDQDFTSAQDQLKNILGSIEGRLDNGFTNNQSLSKAMRESFKQADTALTLSKFLDIEHEYVPSIDNINQKMTGQDINDFLAGFAPANS
jgi:uncharacterized protein YdcH (DUF465 family)